MNKLFYFIISLFLLFACGNDGDGTSTEKPIKFSAIELMSDFEKNTDKMNKKLYLKAVEVSGELMEVDAGSLGATIFTLRTKSKDYATIKCNMLQDDLNYEPGDKVKIRGYFKEYEFHITLDKCITVAP